MKLITNLPKKFFKSKKSRSISRSENPSFGSTTTNSSSDSLATPTSVLPEHTKRKIHKEELEAILTRVGPEPPTEEEVLLLLNRGVDVDVDGDGCISVEELRATFEFFDVDHDGKITAEELFNVFTAIGDSRCTLEDCRRIIRGVDKNRDGFVCFEDFCIMMEQ